MTRRRKAAPSKAKKGGLLTGMRQGVKSMAGSPSGGEKVVEAPPSRVKNIVINVITGAAVLVAAGVMLQRCGVIHF